MALYSLHTALQGLSLGEMLGEFVAAGAELEGLLHLLEHLLVVAERDSFCLSLESSPCEKSDTFGEHGTVKELARILRH